MNLTRTYAIFLRQWYVTKRLSRLHNIFYWSTVDLVLWGFITVYLNRVGNTGFNFVTVMLGAVLLWNFLIRIQFGFSISFLEDVWVRNFINLFSTPLSIAEYVTGILLVSAVSSLTSLIFTAILAWLLFAYNIFEFGFLLIPWVGILFVFGWAIGLVSMSAVLRFGPSAESFAWTLPFIFSPFSSVFYPIESLPEWAQLVARALPTAYVFEGMRSALLRGVLEVGTLFIALVLAIVYFALAFGLLVLAYKTVLKRGLITRFSTD